MPFLENKILRISFIVKNFLSGKWITTCQPEQESTSINKRRTPVTYVWSICTQPHSCTSLGQQCKVGCVKFLNSLHFFASFYIFFDIMRISQLPCFYFYPFFVWPLLHSVYHHVHFLSPIFFLFFWWGAELPDPIVNQSIFYGYLV